ncbi:MAG: hypothetical protein K2L92_02975 [Muribaculaceae bacterium]|nr:hypothetical protein [Muribaculaceae bacterium]
MTAMCSRYTIISLRFWQECFRGLLLFLWRLLHGGAGAVRR